MRALKDSTYLRAADSWEAIGSWLDALVAIQEDPDGLRGCAIGLLVTELADADEGARTELCTPRDRATAAA